MVVSYLGTGCSNWLDVKPSTRVEQEEMFSTEDGFKNTLTGGLYQAEE